MTYNFYIANAAKLKLYDLLLYKVREGVATVNELNILIFLECDDEVKQDRGYEIL